MRLVCLLLLSLVLFPAVGGAQAKKARKTLSHILSVDGAGSGLDADRLQGKAPEQLGADAIAAVMAYISANDYTREASVPVGGFACNCAVATCDDGNDYRVNCSGGFFPLEGFQGDLTAVGAAPGTFNSCGACGCSETNAATTLTAGVVCITVP